MYKLGKLNFKRRNTPFIINTLKNIFKKMHFFLKNK